MTTSKNPKPIDVLAFAKERQAKLEAEHTALQQQFARSQQFLNEVGGKIALVQGRIAENADTLKALEALEPQSAEKENPR